MKNLIIIIVLLLMPCIVCAEIAYGESGIINLGPAVGNSQKAVAVEMRTFELTVSPNPFSTSLDIQVLMQNAEFGMGNMEVGIFDVTGKLVHSAFRNPHSALTWNATNHPAGIYIVKVTVGNRILSKRIVLIK
jgi:hypothetical protein